MLGLTLTRQMQATIPLTVAPGDGWHLCGAGSAFTRRVYAKVYIVTYRCHPRFLT